MAPPRTTSDSENLTTASAAVFARHYLLERAVETGNTTAVWRATDRRDGQPVALKFFPPELIRTPTDFLTVRDLIAPVRQLAHPHVIAAAEVATDQDFSAVVTPWIDGPTLVTARQKQAQKCFAISDIEKWVHTLVDVFATAHERGIAHGALTPHVIFVRPGQGLGVSGFGINAWLRLASRTIFGPPKHDERAVYASPAVRHGAVPQPVDDVFAFGAIVYELITGAAPRGASAFRRHRHAVPMEQQRRKLKHFGTPIPPTWEALVQACLEPEASRRLPSFVEIRTRLGLIPPEPITESEPSAGVPVAFAPAAAPENPGIETETLVSLAANPAHLDDADLIDTGETSTPAATRPTEIESEDVVAVEAQDSEPSAEDSTAFTGSVRDEAPRATPPDEFIAQPKQTDVLPVVSEHDIAAASPETFAHAPVDLGATATLPLDKAAAVEPELVGPIPPEAEASVSDTATIPEAEIPNVGIAADDATTDAATIAIEPALTDASLAVDAVETLAPGPHDEPTVAAQISRPHELRDEIAEDGQGADLTVPPEKVSIGEVVATNLEAADSALWSPTDDDTVTDTVKVKPGEPATLATLEGAASADMGPDAPMDETDAVVPTEADEAMFIVQETDRNPPSADPASPETDIAAAATEAASILEASSFRSEVPPEESVSKNADETAALEDLNPPAEATDIGLDRPDTDVPVELPPDVEYSRDDIAPVPAETAPSVAAADVTDMPASPGTESPASASDGAPAAPDLAPENASIAPTPPFVPTFVDPPETPAETVLDEWRPHESLPSPATEPTDSPREEIAPSTSVADDRTDAETGTPASAYVPMEPLLPRRGPLRHVPSPADQPRVLFPRSSYYERHDNALGPRLVRGALYLVLVVGLVGGGWWGWQTYHVRQEYIELWRDVQLFPPDADEAQRAALADRLEDARPRLSRKQWQDLQEAWENQPANRNRR